MTQPALFQAPEPPRPAPGHDMDPWLRALLETKTGGFRAAKWGRCPRCQELTLTGIDGDVAAATVTVDPTPITTQQEHACLTIRRGTYNLTKRGRSYDIHDRDSDHLYGPIPVPPKPLEIIVPEHRCGARYPGFLPRPPRTAAAGHDDPPPF